MNCPDWISTKELAKIQGVTVRAVRKAITEKRFIARINDSNTGDKYQVFVPSLKPDVQNLIKFEKKENDIEKNGSEVCEKEVCPPHAKEIALARYDLIKLWNEYKQESVKKTQAGQEFIDLYNNGQIYQNLYKILGNVAIGTIYRWAKAIKQKDSWKSLIPDYKYGESEWNVQITREEELVFMNLLLSPNKTNIGKATRLTKFILSKKGFESPTNERNFRRYAENYKKKNYDKWVLARDGQKALRDRVEPYIVRDASLLNVGDVIIADGHRLAFLVINPFTGKPVRATLVGYLDWKSFALCGFEIMLEENTQCIASALRNSIINLGKMPLISYQDNGKAFRSKFFTADFRECGINGIFANLGIVPVFANPYNARAKLIERFFREFQDSFERLLPSFVGSSISDKPAYMLRNEPMHKEIHSGYIPTIEEAVELINRWMEFHNSQPCPHIKGKTIGEVFNEGKGDGVDADKLDDLMLAQEIKTIHRNGIRFLKADYYNENLYGLREKVIIKYSLFDLSKVRVYTLQGKFLCEAERVMPVHPMANYLGDAKDVEELKFKIKQQKRLEKQTIKEVKQFLLGENVKLTDWQNPQELIEIKAETQKSIQVKKPKAITCKVKENSRPIFEHKYQRYEWHLQNGLKSEDEKLWFENYQKSTEFIQIYGGESEKSICKN
jgi:putative transposase